MQTLNAEVLNGQVPDASGFSLAEAIATMPSEFSSLASPENPRIIFYSGESGGISTNQCAHVVTNRADVLPNTIVSILEDRNLKRLDSARMKPLIGDND